jgi:small subunit ribosomal protein S21
MAIPLLGEKMALVVARKGEHPEALIRRFQKEVEQAGIMRELKKRRHFMSASQKRREKRKAAEKRRRKEEAASSSK